MVNTAKKRALTYGELVEAARTMVAESDGQLRAIDDYPAVCRDANGAWIMVWAWVPYRYDTGEEEEAEQP